MENLKTSTKVILTEIAKRYPDSTEFRKQQIVDVAESLGYSGKDYNPLMTVDNRVKIGTYDLASVILPMRESIETNNVIAMPNNAMAMQSITNDEKTFATKDDTFVPWGAYHDVVKVIKSGMFYPMYISGMSGNGKTFMVEQACAKLKKEFIRVIQPLMRATVPQKRGQRPIRWAEASQKPSARVIIVAPKGPCFLVH